MTKSEKEFLDLLEIACREAKKLNDIVDLWSEELRKRHAAKVAI
jgi:hypothetical protein